MLIRAQFFSFFLLKFTNIICDTLLMMNPLVFVMIVWIIWAVFVIDFRGE